MFGDGGWRIGLCARIPNEPMYQLVDMSGLEINIALLQHDGGSSVITNCTQPTIITPSFYFVLVDADPCDPWRVPARVFLLN